MSHRRHGRAVYFIEGEGLIAPILPAPRAIVAIRAAAGITEMPALASTPAIANAADVEAAAPEEITDPARAFRFGRMFPGLVPGNFDDTDLIALGEAMDDVAPPGASNSTIPAGFTYLGQFVDHDITFDRTAGLPAGTLQPEDILQGRSPSLDLDSVYGMGPDISPELYEADKVHLRLGMTTGRPTFGELTPRPNDVPRQPRDPDGTKDRRAIIGDPRNDENLAVSQTHVAFLKFHNKVVDKLAAAPAHCRFDMAQEVVTLHYQSIVFHDFVRRLADSTVFNDVLTSGRKFFHPGPVDRTALPPMPVEFSGAAYRLGHSMIRNGYQWNKVFNSGGPGPVASLGLLFLFSRVSGDLQNNDTVPSDWIVDWRRLYDFSEHPGGVRHPQLNLARLIDPNLAPTLEDLPEFQGVEEHLRFLSVRNLLRGRLLGLPTGQAVAGAIGEPPLTSTELGAGPQGPFVTSLGFDTATPLWYYVLKEAEIQQGGLRLGKVGSRIVVETFHALIEASRHSIFREPDWKPTLPAIDTTRFQMTDLLTFVDDINPLGD